MESTSDLLYFSGFRYFILTINYKLSQTIFFLFVHRFLFWILIHQSLGKYLHYNKFIIVNICTRHTETFIKNNSKFWNGFAWRFLWCKSLYLSKIGRLMPFKIGVFLSLWAFHNISYMGKSEELLTSEVKTEMPLAFW